MKLHEQISEINTKQQTREETGKRMAKQVILTKQVMNKKKLF